MRDKELFEECMAYFRSRPVFQKVFQGFREKYLSYGSFSGTVVLRQIKGSELEDLEGFFRKSFHGQKSISVSAVKFEKALRDSRFAEIEPKDILESYFGEAIEGKKEKALKKHRLWQELTADLAKQYEGTPAGVWLEELASELSGEVPEKSLGELSGEVSGKPLVEVSGEVSGKSLGEVSGKLPGKKLSSAAAGEIAAYIRKRCREAEEMKEDDTETREKLLRIGVKILNHLPVRQGRTEYLAVFAAGITGNPHAFDQKERNGQYLTLLIRWNLGWSLGTETDRCDKEDDRGKIFPAFRRQREYLAAGILCDDISNYAMLCGVRACKRDGTFHEGMEGFAAAGDMVHVPLAVIAGWKRLECVENRIYIVENPSVYAMLCGKWGNQRSFMCMNGQPRLSALMILDLLSETDTEIWYGGDFDPEGLLIAQKICQYYRGSVVFWHMSPEDYAGAKSGEEISERRIRMLDGITEPRLIPAAKRMRIEKKAGYQENIWEAYQNPGMTEG